MTRRALLALLLTAPALPQADAPIYLDHDDLLYRLGPGGERLPVRNVDEWRERRSHIRAALERVMGPFPAVARGPVNARTREERRFNGFVRRKILYEALPNDPVPAYLFLPEASGRRPAALALHPTGEPGKDIVAGETDRPNRSYAAELARRGWVVLAPDYPTMGEPQTDPYDLGYESTTMKGVYNHSRGLDLLASLAQVDPNRMAAIGHSLGGHNALFVAAFDERVRATVTSCGFNSFHHYYGGDLTGWSSRKYMPRIASEYGKDPKRMPFDFSEILGVIAPRAVFVAAPTEDDNFAVEGVRRSVASARPVYERIYHAGERLRAVHPSVGHDFPPDVREAAYAFLERWCAPPLQ